MHLKSNRGQISIFVAFIFQVLFVFFAMVVNVGLLVHHKINLQNSVDIAAYYGAMKQAEMLNTIAHVNYQMRQSWKLMMFRYRQLGIAGDSKNHPWMQQEGTFRPGGNIEAPVTFNPAFCIAYAPFDFMNEGEALCQDVLGYDIKLPSNVSLTSPTSFLTGLLNFQHSVDNAIKTLVDKATKDCESKSTLNYWAMARFIYGYKSDLVGRKKLLAKLANSMSSNTEDFLDVDGESVREGVRRTLENNLTPQNRDGLANGGIKFFNALAGGECKASGNDFEPPGWLNENFILPLYTVMEGDCSSASVKLVPKFINSGIADSDKPRYAVDPFNQAIQELMPYLQEPVGNSGNTRLYKTSIGFEKNPWCMAYVGVSATSTPSIPFSPFGSVTLSARAFAKPFGGRVGPWYKEKWSSNSQFSDQGKDVDPLLPPRALISQNAMDTADPRRAGDYSRFTGDQIGTKSKLTTGHLAKSIFNTTYNKFLSLSWWNHLTDTTKFDPPGSAGDFLAWDSLANAPPGKMRELEIAAIAPDQFDLTYFSIEPDFYRNYFLRLVKQETQLGFNVRGDLGMRRDSPDAKLKSFSIKDQIANLVESKILDVNALSYTVQDFAELLTSYQSKSPTQPLLDVDRFGQCEESGRLKDEEAPDRATPGNCTSGGRTGYSVKIVDGNYLLRSDLELGGKGVTGAIKNPYPENF